MNIQTLRATELWQQTGAFSVRIQGMGLGRMVMEEAEKWILDLGYTTAVLESRDKAVGFYQTLGYVADFNNRIHGVTFDCIHMEKRLHDQEDYLMKKIKPKNGKKPQASWQRFVEAEKKKKEEASKRSRTMAYILILLGFLALMYSLFHKPAGADASSSTESRYETQLSTDWEMIPDIDAIEICL